ncbi:amino acid adenylation domain-containing protein [Kribbella sp. NPDC004138]
MIEQIGDLVLDLERMRADVADCLREPASAVADDADLLGLGLDSINVMVLAGQWHQAGARVTFAELIEKRTLREWWELVSSRLSQDAAVLVAAGKEEEPFELADMQHAYWVGRADGQPLGGVGAHFYAELDGADVDPERLERAVRALTARHGMLRCVFRPDGRQEIRSESAWPGVSVHDLRGVAAEAAEGALAELRDTLSHRRLAVERGEVFDVQLSLLPTGATRVHVQIEMLVADAHSFRILLAELASLYAAPEATLPPIELSYPEYLSAARASRESAREQAANYWRERLADLPAGPDLPLVRDPGQVTEHRVTRRFNWLSDEQWSTLADHARRHSVTLPVVFLTALTEVLGAWSATPRFALNLPLYDRRPVHSDVPLLVGDFTNLILLEVDTSVRATFAHRAQRIQEQLHADVRHADYSGVDVLRDLIRTRGPAGAGAPVVFTSAIGLGELFSTDVRKTLGDPGWTMSQTPQVWLDFQVTEREGGLYLNWDVVEELFPAGLVDDMWAALSSIIDGLVTAESRWTSTGDDLLPPDQREVRRVANDSGSPMLPRTLHHRVFAYASKHPDKPALLWGNDSSLSYGELAERALHLAGRLVSYDVGRAEPVMVQVPRGPEQVIAVLGVLAAGGSYVPVGVDQPSARRDRIARIAGARLVVTGTDTDTAQLPPKTTAVPVATTAGAGRLTEPVVVDPETIAYTLFTSGSTGDPKGVMVSHRAAANTIDAINERFAVGADDRALAVSALDFDLSVYDIFGLLGAGGSLVVLDDGVRRDADRWVELVTGLGVTIWQSVPVLLEMLLTAAGGRSLGLRLALLGGDWVGLDLPARLAEHSPGAKLVALGGTTETAIHSTVCEVTTVPPDWRSIPYGRPLRGQMCRVVDGVGRDRPDWVPGELWIGGASVADGYREDPERTARQFVDHDGIRWYRTNDRARYRPDGTIEFLGRIDLQVKIRGHRIEPGEVEAAFRSHPSVADALALVVGSGVRRLAVAVVPAAGSAPDADGLREYVGGLLPGYMVPEQIEYVAAWPLSANGKVDRRAIAERLAAPTDPGEYQAPAGAVEALVAEAWTELLGLPAVGRDQSFFALGGDSLVATRLVARLRDAGVRGADHSRLFNAPVLKDFAAGLTIGTAPDSAPALRPAPAERYEPFPLTDVQRAYWIGRADGFALGGVGSHWYWEFDGRDVDLQRLEAAVNRLVGRHDMLRAVIDESGTQRVLPSVPRYVVQVTRTDEAGTEELKALRDGLAHRIPDISRWPLFEIRAVEYGGSRTRLAFSFDYIALDALSIVTFFAELSALYVEPSAGLRPLELSFRDYVVHSDRDPQERETAQRYWLDRVSELPPAPALPLAADPATLTEPHFVRRELRIEAAAWHRLTAQAQRHGVTPAAVLATAYAEVLATWSGQDRLTLNLTLFNRPPVHPGIEHVLGDFTSLLLIEHDARGNDRLIELVRRFQQQLWTDLEHRDVSAIWVLRRLARELDVPAVTMPVVFTSALGVASGMDSGEFPFGTLCWGVSQTPQVWLDNQVMERDGGLVVNWDAVDDLFPAGMLDDMFAAYGRLLEWLTDADWEAPPPELLPAPQRAIRERVNATEGPLPDRTLIHDFFEQAAAAPDNDAVLWDVRERLSYGELAERALRVAGHLRERGLRPGEPVGITLPRGPGQIAAVIGVLAAGGCYVPVAVDQPDERMRRIYAAAGARFVLTGAEQPMPDVLRAIDLTEALRADPLPEPVTVDPDALAYIIYTSGSTGVPKGVEMTHRGALNTIDDVNERCRVNSADRVLAVSSLDFDLSVYDVFGLLSVGGSVVLVDHDDRREAAHWVRLVATRGVTVWNSVPALLDMYLVAAGLGAVTGPLRVAMVSGDWVGLDLAERLRERHPGCRLIALGGATEAGIWSNWFEIESVPSAWRSVPYGVPLRNQAFRVVDRRGHDCPDWVAGELWIGGASVAQGYRGDPVLTAERFLAVDGQRWYRTGDLGRYWPDGTLEFLGRTDFQVKVRGYRIELGEVEAALLGHPDVSRAVAFVQNETAGQRLLAAVVPAPGTLPDLDDLLEFVTGRLPAYMVPDAVAVLDGIPLSGNGKVDRRAVADLAGLDGGSTPGAEKDEPPEPGVEELLAELWRDLLNVAVVGRRQSFFTLGGDSQLAIRLVAGVQRRLGVELSLREVFGAPTLAELAAAVSAHLPGEVDEGEL